MSRSIANNPEYHGAVVTTGTESSQSQAAPPVAVPPSDRELSKPNTHSNSKNLKQTVTYEKNIRKYLEQLSQLLISLDIAQINCFIQILSQARMEQKTVYIFGNGGSGGTASHMACDFNKGATHPQRKRFRVICLNDNIPTMLAYANDVSYDDIFVEQLKNFLEVGDVVIGISGSGNSENVIRAIEYANANGAITIGICGFSGGRLKETAQVLVHVESDDMQKVEDLHLMFGHLATQLLSQER